MRPLSRFTPLVGGVTVMVGMFGIGTASAATFTEVEPNDTKLTANPFTMSPGDVITGVTTGASATTPGLASADNFLITLEATSPGIYRNRLTITTQGTAGHTGTIRGLGQSATNPNSVGPGVFSTITDAVVQTSSTTSVPPRFNQFYTFGAQTRLYYRVTGAAATTSDYFVTLTQEPVSIVSLGSFQPGPITLTNTGLSSTQDTEVFVYDSNFTAIPGFLNDDFLDGTPVPPGGSSFNSLLTRNYAPGTYYVAISNWNTADHQLSPADEGTANSNVMDFPGVMVNSSTTTLASIPFSITDSSGTTTFTASKPGVFDIWFGSFVVVPEPTSLGLLTLGGLALRRRRA